MAHDPSHASRRRGLLCAPRTNTRPAVLARRDPGAVAECRPRSRGAPPICAPSAATRTCRGDVPRRCAAGRHPTAARARRSRGSHPPICAGSTTPRSSTPSTNDPRNDPCNQRTNGDLLTCENGSEHQSLRALHRTSPKESSATGGREGRSDRGREAAGKVSGRYRTPDRPVVRKKYRIFRSNELSNNIPACSRSAATHTVISRDA